MKQTQIAMVSAATGALLGALVMALTLSPVKDPSSAPPQMLGPSARPVQLAAPLAVEMGDATPAARPVAVEWKGPMSPLMAAAHRGDAAEVQACIARGYDVNELSRDGEGKPPLHWAAYCGGDRGLEAARLLVEAGATVDARNTYLGATTLMTAVANNNPELARYLISQGADVNASDNRGRTPLDFALHFNYELIAQLLQAQGAQAGTGKF